MVCSAAPFAQQKLQLGNMSLHVPEFEKANLLIVGDVMLDRYWNGDTNRISPEAPVPVVRVKDHEERPGGAANVALNAAHLGAKVKLLGYAGDDENAQRLENILTQDGVEPHFIKLADEPTVTKLRIMSRHQQLMRLDFEEGFAGQDHSRLLENFEQLIAQADIVILSDYKKGTLEHSKQLIAIAKKHNKLIVVDPKSSDFGDYQGASLITPNLKEFTEASGDWSSENELIDNAQRQIQQHSIDNVLITRSEQGMTLVGKDKTPFNLPTKAREVFDVTGAGDTVVATLAAAWASGEELEQAVALANIAAGIVVGKVGTASVNPQEIEKALQKYEIIEQGVTDEDTLLRAIEDAKANGEKIVMTNGCFDLLHAGHVSYLAEARQLGDRLIVAVNTDDSVRRLKGETRPINTVENRMTVLAALASVDWALPFSEDTPERLICKLKPDILVKGGDNEPQKIPGNRCVWDNGGEVKVLVFKDGISTTKTISRIQNLPKES